MKHDRIVYPIEELRPEVRLQFSLDILLHVEPFGLACFRMQEMFLYYMRTDIAGHYDDGIAEINCSALTIGEPSIVKNLQKNIENIRVGFLDFVK